MPGGKRERLTGHQTQILNKYFQHSQHPKPADFITLEVLTGLPHKRIVVSEKNLKLFYFKVTTKKVT